MKKHSLFARHPAGPPSHSQAFTGHGFLPDLMSEHGASTLPSGNATNLEDGYVPGVQGMMPVSGYTGKAQRGQAQDGGAAGAGSFAARNAFGARG